MTTMKPLLIMYICPWWLFYWIYLKMQLSRQYALMVNNGTLWGIRELGCTFVSFLTPCSSLEKNTIHAAVFTDFSNPSEGRKGLSHGFHSFPLVVSFSVLSCVLWAFLLSLFIWLVSFVSSFFQFNIFFILVWVKIHIFIIVVNHFLVTYVVKFSSRLYMCCILSFYIAQVSNFSFMASGFYILFRKVFYH